MSSFKIVAYNGSKKIGVKGSNLNEIIGGARAKLELDEDQQYKIYLNDGTEIDDDEILIDFGQTPGAILVIVPKNLPWDSSFVEGSSDAVQRKEKTSTSSSSSSNITQDTLNDAAYQSTLFQKFPTSIMECCNKGKPISDRDRRSIVDIIATYMIHDLKKTDRKTAGAISNNLCAMYPLTFKAGLENVGTTVAANVLRQSIYDAVNYRKASNKKSHNENDSDEGETGADNQKKDNREQDEYGCVEYRPLLSPTETAQSQEEKRLELIECDGTDNNSMKKILTLMDETYATQREYIVNNAICEKLFKLWPHLTNYRVLVSHASRLLGIDIHDVWSKSVIEKSKLLKQYFKDEETTKYFNKRQSKGNVSNSDDTRLVRKMINEAKQISEQQKNQIAINGVVFPLMIRWMKEKEEYLYVLIEASVKDEELCEKAQSSYPSLVIRGTLLYDSNSKYDIILEKKFRISVNNFLDGILITFICYYIYGYVYPPEIQRTLEGIQRIFLSINPEKGTKRACSKTKRGLIVDSKIIKLLKAMENYKK